MAHKPKIGKAAVMRPFFVFHLLTLHTIKVRLKKILDRFTYSLPVVCHDNLPKGDFS